MKKRKLLTVLLVIVLIINLLTLSAVQIFATDIDNIDDIEQISSTEVDEYDDSDQLLIADSDIVSEDTLLDDPIESLIAAEDVPNETTEYEEQEEQVEENLEELEEELIVLDEELEELGEDEQADNYGSISGFAWADDDWDGIYSEYEMLISRYPIRLFAADDLTTPIGVTISGYNGKFIFANLPPGSYVLGVFNEYLDDVEYRQPMDIVGGENGNKFAADWSSDPVMAYTDIIEITDGESIQNINAGMLVPISTRAVITLAKLPDAKVHDEVLIDGYRWNVVKVETINNEKHLMLATAVVLNFNNGVNSSFSSTSVDYSTSLLRNRMTKYYKDSPTMQKMAVIPILGNTTTTQGVPAGTQTVDIMFAMSKDDLVAWNGGKFSPLIAQIKNIGQRFWSRTPRTGAELYGVYPTANSIDAGLHYNGTFIGDVPAIWVRANAFEQDVVITIKHVEDKTDNIIAPDRTVTIPKGSLFSFNDATEVDGYQFLDKWSMTLNTGMMGMPVLLMNVQNDTTVYLYYVKEMEFITTHYIDKTTGLEVASPSTVSVFKNGSYNVDTFLTVYEYEFLYEWNYTNKDDPMYPFPGVITNIITDIDIYLYYEPVKTGMDLVITKEVTGYMANKNKEFEFTIYLLSLDITKPLQAYAEFEFVGGTLNGSGNITPPDGGVLQMDINSMGKIYLKHGQTITIKNIPEHLWISILETPDSFYDASFTDTKDNSTGGEEMWLRPLLTDNGVRVINFVNERVTVPPTGVSKNDLVPQIILFTITPLILSSTLVLQIIKKRR